MVIYRIADCRYIKDLTGRGAAMYGGRWNSKDIKMLYTAGSAALALLEAVVHIGKIPELGFCMISLEIPEDSIMTYHANELPGDWSASPAPDYLKMFGDKFINAGANLALKVPSVVMPEEYNILLNPDHEHFDKVKLLSHRPLSIDNRLLHAAGKATRAS